MKFLTSADIPNADFAAGGLLLVDKPLGWTSFDVVARLRGLLSRIAGVKRLKVGHSGTLDPMATGLLLLCTGKWTKKLHDLQGLDKSYDGSMQLGGVTASYDAESPVAETRSYDHVTPELIAQVATSFVGEIQQVPPVYSAIKVKGQPLHRLARKGVDITPAPRTVHIHTLQITGIDFPAVSFHVDCGKGTYIRSLAHDMGQSLSCGAYLTRLRRTAIGPFALDDAWALPELVQLLTERLAVAQTKAR